MIVGVVGKSGSGKTTISTYLIQKGYYHLDTDTLTEPTYNKFKNEIVKLVGNSILVNGNISKSKLHRILVKSETLRLEVEKLLVPDIEKQVRGILKTNKKVTIDSAILHKLKLEDTLELILYIDTPWYLRVYRLLKRDNYNLRKILVRLWIQRDIKIDIYNKAKLVCNVDKINTLYQINKLL